MTPPDDPLQSLPASVQVLWGLREAGRRGPKPSLSREEIVRAAITIADAEGLAAVSMARVAERLDVSTMALYRYVTNKDELLLLMSDAAFPSPPDLPADLGWRACLEQWAWAVREARLARPWLQQLPVTGPPAGPNSLLWLDAGLRALAATSLSAAERVGVVLLLTVFVAGDARLSLDLAAAAVDDPQSYALDYGGAFATLLDPQRYPALVATIAEGAFEDGDEDDLDEQFAFGLGIVLDGIAHRIDA